MKEMFFEIGDVIYNSDNILSIRLNDGYVVIRLSDGSEMEITPTERETARLIAKDIYASLCELLDAYAIEIQKIKEYRKEKMERVNETETK